MDYEGIQCQLHFIPKLTNQFWVIIILQKLNRIIQQVVQFQNEQIIQVWSYSFAVLEIEIGIKFSVLDDYYTVHTTSKIGELWLL